jgi:cyclophilin family peptidyl-prolyl cis-trans isomerase
MITDKFLRVSDAQAVTTTAVSTDKIDLSQARDIGEGDDLYMVFTVGTAFAGGTSINFNVTVADDAALSTNATTIGMSGVIVTASLTAASQFIVRLNPQIASLGRRYLGATYTVVGTMSAGTVTADIVSDIQDGKKFYAGGFAVL